MRTFLLFILLILSSTIPAQQDTAEMFRALDSMAEDSTKVMFLLEVGDVFYLSDPNRAKQYYHQARELALKIDYPFGVGKGWIYLGFLNNVHGQYADGIENNQRAFEVFRNNKDTIEMAKALINVGNAYNFQSAYDLALPYYLEAAGYFERKGEPYLLAFTLGNIHTVLLRTRDYEQALIHAERMVNIAPLTQDSLLITEAIQKKGLSLLELARYDEALLNLEKALDLATILKDPISETVANSNLGEYYYRTEDYARATFYFEKGLIKARDMGDPFYLVEALGDVGKVMTASNQTTVSRSLLQEALDISRSSNNKQSELDTYAALAKLEESAGKLAQAGAYWQRHASLQDTIFDENSSDQIAALNMRYQTTVRESRIAALETENELQQLRLRQRNWFLIALSSGLLILLGLIYLIRRNNRQRQEINRQSAELQRQEILRLEREQALVALRASMEGEQRERLRIAEDLHDDFGSGLSKIAFLSDALASQDSKKSTTLHKIAAASRQLQGKMGEIVWALNTGNDSLESLTSYLRHYLQEYFDGTDIKYSLSTTTPLINLPLTGEQRRGLFLIVKESLNNVLKHSQASEVSIFVKTDQGLNITVQDNGQGFAPGAASAHSNGLRNMEKRMEQLGGAFSVEASHGVKISLSLPI